MHVCLAFLKDKQPLVVKAPRRTGKTTTVIELAARLEPTHWVCIVASNKSSARSCLQAVAGLLRDSEVIGTRVVSTGGWVQCGTKIDPLADIVLVDDAQYMDPAMWSENLDKRFMFIGKPTGNPNKILSSVCRMKDSRGDCLCRAIDIAQRGAAL